MTDTLSAPAVRFGKIAPMLAIFVAVGLSLSAIVWLYDGRFTIVPLILAFVSAGVVVLLAVFQPRNCYRLTDTALEVRASLQKRIIRYTDIAQVDLVNLRTQPDYQPDGKINGIYMMGLSSGVVGLKNRDTAFVMITEFENVVRIETHQGKIYQLSVKDPQPLIDKISELIT